MGKGEKMVGKGEERVGEGASALKAALERTGSLWRDGSNSSSGSGRELGMAQGEFIPGIAAPAPGEGREAPGSGRDRCRDQWSIRPESRERLEGTGKGGKVGALGMFPRDDPGEMSWERLGSSLPEFSSWSGSLSRVTQPGNFPCGCKANQKSRTRIHQKPGEQSRKNGR